MYYAGHDGLHWRIGLAEEFLPTPYFSQKDPLWANDLYDNMADNMASVGCAVTSAAMILKHYNVFQTPGNPETGLPAKELTPGTLNEWLKDTNDAYFRNGATNFVSIANMTQKSNQLNPTSPKLEYSQGTNLSELNSELINNRPAILKLEYPPSPADMHFVVATGSADNNYDILDPYYEDRTQLYPDYSNVLRVDKFQVTSSDFSYLIFAVDENVNIELRNSANESVGQIQLEAPIYNQINQTSTGEETLKVLYFKYPQDDTYILKISAYEDQNFQLDAYLYDINGDGEKEIFNGMVGPNDTDEFVLNFDQDNILNTHVNGIQQLSDSLISIINSANTSGEISHKGTFNSLSKKATNIDSYIVGDDKEAALELINSLLAELSAQRDKHVTEIGFQMITNVANNLQSSLLFTL
jgi:hypothetical protein